MKKAVLFTIILITVSSFVSAQRTAEQYNPDKFYLTVTSNIDDANVFIDYKYVGQTGQAYAVSRGRHVVQVESEGCSDYYSSVNVTRNLKVYAHLKQLTHRLKLTANAENARVWINGTDYGRLSLNSPLRIDLKAGQINIKISAEGYFLFEKLITLNKDFDFYAELLPQTATIKLIVPEYYLAAYRNAEKFIILSVDGKVCRGHELEISSGEHDVTITTGGISFTQKMYLKPGAVYEISPVFSFNVNQINQGLSMR